MNKLFILTLFCFLITEALFSQAPQAFKYQAIARDEAGNILTNRDIAVRISMIQEDSDNNEAYIESHLIKSNPFGMINLLIGEGMVNRGNFPDIKWGEDSYSIRIEIDINGGNDFKLMGTSGLYAVPYALYAEKAGNLIEKEPVPPQKQHKKKPAPKKHPGSRDNGTPNSKIPANGDSYLNVNIGNVGIGTTDPQEKLDVVGTVMASEGFNSDGNDGLTDTLNFVTDNDYTADKLKYRTLFFNGGILTYISDQSAWEDTVGNYILPWDCGDSLFDSRDSTYYQTVLIGAQCWMAENLNIGTWIESANNQTDNSIIEKYCYNDSEDTCDVYGGLYLWNEMMQYVTDTGAQGICPSGWYIPSDEEWKILEGIVDSQYGVGDPEWEGTGFRGLNVGYRLKSITLWYSNGYGNDYFGFTALPGGTWYQSGDFLGLGGHALFWSSTEMSGSSAWYRYIRYNKVQVVRQSQSKADAMYVRCLQDCSPKPTQANAGPDQLNLQDTNAVLAGNTPLIGLGSWSIVSGTGGIIADSLNPTSSFSGLAGHSYDLIWAITTRCGSTSNSVTISFAGSGVFNCGDELTDPRDSKQYNTVQIGSQCWMAENLNVGTKIYGIFNQTHNFIIEKYCYNDEEDSCNIYGGLYQWDEMMQYVTTVGAQGICPDGWHIPGDDEWKILEGNIDSQYGVGDPEWDNDQWRGFDAGYNIKSEYGWENAGNGIDLYNFTAKPGGIRESPGDFINHGVFCIFRSSTEYNSSEAWYRRLYKYEDRIHRDWFYYPKYYGLSVRCIENDL